MGPGRMFYMGCKECSKECNLLLSVSIECVLLFGFIANVLAYYRICSLTIECVRVL